MCQQDLPVQVPVEKDALFDNLASREDMHFVAHSDDKEVIAAKAEASSSHAGKHAYRIACLDLGEGDFEKGKSMFGKIGCEAVCLKLGEGDFEKGKSMFGKIGYEAVCLKLGEGDFEKGKSMFGKMGCEAVCLKLGEGDFEKGKSMFSKMGYEAVCLKLGEGDFEKGKSMFGKMGGEAGYEAVCLKLGDGDFEKGKSMFGKIGHEAVCLKLGEGDFEKGKSMFGKTGHEAACLKLGDGDFEKGKSTFNCRGDPEACQAKQDLLSNYDVPLPAHCRKCGHTGHFLKQHFDSSRGKIAIVDQCIRKLPMSGGGTILCKGCIHPMDGTIQSRTHVYLKKQLENKVLFTASEQAKDEFYKELQAAKNCKKCQFPDGWRLRKFGTNYRMFAPEWTRGSGTEFFYASMKKAKEELERRKNVNVWRTES